MNRFKRKLRAGEAVFGQIVLELFTPGIGPMLDACGMDFVIYDMEHGRCDIALAAEMMARRRDNHHAQFRAPPHVCPAGRT